MAYIKHNYRQCDGRLCFHKCGSVKHCGGTPSLSHNTYTGPMSFLGYSSDWSHVPSVGYPIFRSQVPWSEYPQTGVPTSPPRTGAPTSPTFPRPAWEIPSQDWGIPPLAKTGEPSPHRQAMLGQVTPRQYSSCGFHRRTFLLSLFLSPSTSVYPPEAGTFKSFGFVYSRIGNSQADNPRTYVYLHR